MILILVDFYLRNDFHYSLKISQLNFFLVYLSIWGSDARDYSSLPCRRVRTTKARTHSRGLHRITITFSCMMLQFLFKYFFCNEGKYMGWNIGESIKVDTLHVLFRVDGHSLPATAEANPSLLDGSASS